VTLRQAHGNGAGALVRVETAPADELPLGVQAQPHASARDERTPDGRFLPGARTVQAAGGAATRGKSRLAAKLGLAKLADDAAFAPYSRSASVFRRAQCAELARTVGGGVCGPGPSSIVASAALMLAWSRYLSDLAAAGGDPDLVTRSARLADQSRQALLTAHELCAREAEARAKAPRAGGVWDFGSDGEDGQE
jgi:hypothetical protein